MKFRRNAFVATCLGLLLLFLFCLPGFGLSLAESIDTLEAVDSLEEAMEEQNLATERLPLVEEEAADESNLNEAQEFEQATPEDPLIEIDSDSQGIDATDRPETEAEVDPYPPPRFPVGTLRSAARPGWRIVASGGKTIDEKEEGGPLVQALRYTNDVESLDCFCLQYDTSNISEGYWSDRFYVNAELSNQLARVVEIGFLNTDRSWRNRFYTQAALWYITTPGHAISDGLILPEVLALVEASKQAPPDGPVFEHKNIDSSGIFRRYKGEGFSMTYVIPDKSGKLSDYELVSVPYNVTAHIEGNSLHLRIGVRADFSQPIILMPKNKSAVKEHFFLKSLSDQDVIVLGSTLAKAVELRLGEEPHTLSKTLQIRKLDAKTKETITGAKFALFCESVNSNSLPDHDLVGNYIPDYLIDYQGDLCFVYGVPPGKYRVIEIEAPEGYRSNPHFAKMESGPYVGKSYINIEVPQESSTGIYSIEIENPPLERPVRIQKRDALTGLAIKSDTKQLSYDLRFVAGVGDQPSVYKGRTLNPGDVLAYDLKASPDGLLEITDLVEGEYDIVERQPPNSHHTNPTAVRFAVLKDEAGELQVHMLSENRASACETHAELEKRYQERRAELGFEALAMPSSERPYQLFNESETPAGEINFYDRPIFAYVEIEKWLTGGDEEGIEAEAKFEILDAAGTVVETLSTNQEGKAISSLLPAGTYRLRQVAGDAKYNYIDEQSFVIDSKSEILKFKLLDTAKHFFLKVKKIDAMSQQAIVSKLCCFKLYRQAEGGEALTLKMVGEAPSELLCTDSEGMISLETPLVYGDYYLEELETDPAYYLDPNRTRYHFRIDSEAQLAAGDVFMIEIENRARQAQFSLEKHGEVLEAIGFEALEIRNLLEVAEDDSLANYELHPEVQAGGLSKLKLDFVDRPLSGVGFVLYAEQDIAKPGQDPNSESIEYLHRKGDEVLRFETDAQGQYQSPQLALGLYRLHELEAPLGYAEVEDLLIDLRNEDQSLEIFSHSERLENQRQRFQLNLNKEFETPKYSRPRNQRAVFALVNSEEMKLQETTIPVGSIMDVVVVDGASELSLEAALAGKYVVRELACTKGYQLSEDEIVELNYQTAPSTYLIKKNLAARKNALKSARLSLVKRDANSDQPLAGVKFILWAMEDGGRREAARFETDESGMIVIDELNYGRYYLEEAEALPGYRMGEGQEVVVDGETTELQLEFKNEESEVLIRKEDAEGRALVDAELALYDSEGVEIERWTSTAEAHRIRGLEIDRVYELREITAPPGYRRGRSLRFKLDASGIETIQFKNEKTSLRVKKLDRSSGELLADCELRIVDEGGEEVCRFTTEKRVKRIRGLEIAKRYRLEELTAAEGYSIAEPLDFVLNDAGDMELLFYNDRIDGGGGDPPAGSSDSSKGGRLPSTGEATAAASASGFLMSIAYFIYMFKRRL
ncbi:MAG: SpaA isopeptide-forming pilin-related protein [Eubacteriales bacterium]|nr:SpaA isopeptide-forming pilin-related protein [Eubacteriales bacterium]